jgi:anthranilate synthase component 1
MRAGGEVGAAPWLGPLAADDDGERHCARVARILEYIRAGDVYQVNLARRLVSRISAPGDALRVYAALAEVAPAPYGALIEADGVTVISGSPERFLGAVGDRIETRPIKGTRPRTAGGAQELAASAKDAAEHLMIVDLERNDLGRVCRVGSVRVDAFAEIASLPTVHHLVSTVRGRLRADVDLAALLAATFPGGSITGAPKIRAMEIIAELETEARGVYTGALGLLAPGGDVELGLPIRTAVVRDGTLTYGAGGGIVADSDAGRELAECWTKTSGLRRVLGERTAPGFERCSSG